MDRTHRRMTGPNMEKGIAKLINADIERRHVYTKNDITSVVQILDLDVLNPRNM